LFVLPSSSPPLLSAPPFAILLVHWPFITPIDHPTVRRTFSLIRRGPMCRFRVPVVHTMMKQVLNDRLNSAIYDKDQAPGWAHEIAEEIKLKLIGSWSFFALLFGLKELLWGA
jgi:hypothetical protein